MTLEPGTVLAGYEIEQPLGRGGMGVVYLARDLRLGRRVALKLLSPDLADDESFRERFVRESRLAASIDHPNIVPVFEAGEAEGSLYIAMRYVEGEDLGDVLRREGKLDPARAASVVEQIGGALDAAHELGLVHRDVKPGNILIGRGATSRDRDHCYLSDFGITREAASFAKSIASGLFAGTLDYASPEQIRGDPVDGRADVYSLGCVLYECLTGSRPFARDTDVALLYAHLQDPPPRATDAAPQLPPDVDGVVARALAKSPAERFQTCHELTAAVRDALGGRGPGRPTRAAETAIAAHPRPAPRTRRMALAAGSGVVLLVIALAVVATTRSPSRPNAGRSPGAPARADPDDPASYYTLDGSRPRRYPECNGVFSLCLGSPVERAIKMFGLEQERYGVEDKLNRRWTVGKANVTIESDRLDAVVGMTASWDPAEAKFRLALPERLLLGESTMGDVVAALGRPHETDSFVGENIPFYIYAYFLGGEGSERVEFTYSASGFGEPDDPGGFNDALDAKKVTSFSAKLGAGR